MKPMVVVVVVVATLYLAVRAGAADADPAASWRVGVDGRTDLGTHALRLDSGVQWSHWEATLVLDPSYVFDHQHDLDVRGQRLFAGGRWGVMAGWRVTSLGLADGTHWQHRSLVGVTAALPSLAGGSVQGRAGFEIATLWLRHGTGDTQWVDPARLWLDVVNLGLFVRFDYVSSL